jgi:putative ABC transport system permease protein
MLRTTFANLSRRKLRLLATSLAVLLGVMFTAGTLVLTDSLGATFDTLFTDVYGQTSAVVRSNQKVKGGLEFGNAPTRGRLDDALVTKVAAIDGVADAVGTTSGYTQIVKSNGKALGNPNQGPPTMGGNWIDNPALNPYRIVSGHAPESADQIVMDVSSAKTGHYRIGQQVPLLTTTGRITKTLVGVTKFGDADNAGGSTSVHFTLAESQRVLGLGNQVDEIWVEAKPGVSQTQMVAAIQAAHLPNAEAITGAKAAADAKKAATSFLSFFTVFLLVFALIALLVGAFIIANTFSILIAQRTRELALMRAIGASRGQVLGSVVIEAGVVGVIASAVGLGLGYLVATGLQTLLMGGSGLSASTTLSVRTVVSSFVIGIGVTVLSALLPARKASKVAPVTAMRDSAIEDTSHSLGRTIVGAVFLVIAALSLIGAALSDTAQLVGLGALAGLVGAVVFGPALAGGMARAAGPLLGRSGMAGHLGQENVLRNPRRTASTASALMIGATLVCAISVFAASAVASINNLVDTGFHGDVVVTSTGNGIPKKDIARISANPKVGEVAAMEYAPATIGGEGTLVSATDLKALSALVDLQVQQGDVETLGTNEIAVSESKAKSSNWHLGTKVQAHLLDGSSPTFTVRAIYRNPLVAQGVLASPETVKGSLLAPLAQIAFVDGRPGVSADQLRAAIDKTFKGNPTAKVQTNSQFKKSAAAQMDTFLNIVYAMLALAVIIAIIGIVNTLALSIMERTRELGLLRAVGMTRRQLRSTVRIEALLIALTGTIIGLVLGTAIGSALIKSFGPDQALTGFALPWVRLIVVLVAGVLVGLLAAILPARRAARLDPLDALATE